MENEQFTTLVNTLLDNNLASSPSEARRMAEEMIGTSAKVQDSFKKENHTYMVSNFSQKEDKLIKEVAGTQNPQEKNSVQETRMMSESTPEPKSNDAMQNNIQELRERAINPQPVNVQVDFQTPDFDARQEVATSAQEPLEPVNLAQQPTTEIETLANDFQVNIPGIDTSQTLNNLTDTTNTPQAVDVPAREKDDFLTVRLEAESEQAPRSSPEANLQAQARESEQEESIATAQQSFSGLDTGFPTQQVAIQEQAPEPIPENIAPKGSIPQTNTPERKKDLWTPEERKLKEDCDLSKVFNFSGQ